MARVVMLPLLPPMAGVVPAPPPTAGVVPPPPPTACVLALNWGRVAFDLHLSWSAYGIPSRFPVLSCRTEFQVHRFHDDGRLRNYERVNLPVRRCDASTLATVPGAEEQLLSDVISFLTQCGGLPYPELDCVVGTLLFYVRHVAAWALQGPGWSPFLTQIRASFHVRMISEEEGMTVNGYGEQLPSPRTAAPTTVTTAMDNDQLGAGSSSGEEQEEELESCAICLEKMARGERSWLPCSHSFHEHCIGRWLQQRPQCPLCRFDVATPPPSS